MNDSRSQYPDTQDLMMAIFTIMVLLLGVYIGYKLGHDRGVRDHASGKYTTVELPNGDTIVVENKR